MNFITHSHRFAKAIIDSDAELSQRYNEFVDALSSITDNELIADYERRKAEHAQRNTAFKSLTPSINGLLKEKVLQIPGWHAEVDIFNDVTDVLGDTEWRLDFACDNALCVEVAFNHGEAIAWNLLKPVLSCELNHVRKAIQGRVGIYVCATDAMKKVANIDSASGSYEKVLRYLTPMMNQLTVPMMIIGLTPFDGFKINASKEIVQRITGLDESWVQKRILITLNDCTTIKGIVSQFIAAADSETGVAQLSVHINARTIRVVSESEIKFIEIAR